MAHQQPVRIAITAVWLVHLTLIQPAWLARRQQIDFYHQVNVYVKLICMIMEHWSYASHVCIIVWLVLMLFRVALVTQYSLELSIQQLRLILVLVRCITFKTVTLHASSASTIAIPVMSIQYALPAMQLQIIGFSMLLQNSVTACLDTTIILLIEPV